MCRFHYNTMHLECALYCLKRGHFCHREVLLCPLPLNVGRFCDWFHQEDTVEVTLPAPVPWRTVSEGPKLPHEKSPVTVTLKRPHGM